MRTWWRRGAAALAAVLAAACSGGDQAPQVVETSAAAPAATAAATTPGLTASPTPAVTAAAGDLITLPADWAACDDEPDDIDASRYRRYPDRPRPLRGDRPGHGEIRTAEVGLDDATLAVTVTLAGAVPSANDGTFASWSSSVEFYVRRKLTYSLTIRNDDAGGLDVSGTDFTKSTTKKTKRGERTTFAAVDFQDRGTGVGAASATAAVSRAELPLLDKDFRWVAYVSSWDGDPEDRTRGSFDMGPNLTATERGALFGFPLRPDGEFSKPSRELMSKLPGKP